MGGVFSRKRTASRQASFDAIEAPSLTHVDIKPAAQYQRQHVSKPEEPTSSQPAIGMPIATGSVVQAPSTTAEPLTLQVSSEKAHISHDEEHKMLAMLSVKAPSAPEQVKRPPLDLVACIDRSGSMRGDKMRLMRQTLELLVTRAGLNGEDRISIVTFDREVKLDLPLVPMNKDGQARAANVVRGVHPGSTTNLSGGVLKSIDVLSTSGNGDGNRTSNASVNGDGNRTRAVMVFSDGLANEGIKDTQPLIAAVNGALAAASAAVGGPMCLFTFGFGADHNEDCLRALATNSGPGGLYYYVGSADDIPNAFADCLGGLTSIVAQNATLHLEGLQGASVSRVLGSSYAHNAQGSIELGDLFAEDEKDILVEILLPKLTEPTELCNVLRATLRAFNVNSSSPEVVNSTLELARPTSTPTSQPVNLALDEQRNRIYTAEAMEKASQMADAGDVSGGRSVLAACRMEVASTSSAEQKLSSHLVREMDMMERHFESAAAYRSVGSKMSKMHAMSHARQRAVHTNADAYSSAACNKKSLKASWGFTK